MTLIIVGLGLLNAVLIGRNVAALRRTPPGEERQELWTSLTLIAGTSLILVSLLPAPTAIRFAALGLALPFVGIGGLRTQRQLSHRRNELFERTTSAATSFERLDALEARREMVSGRLVRRQLSLVGMQIVLIATMVVTIIRSPVMAKNPVFLILLIFVAVFVVRWIVTIHRNVTERRWFDAEIDSLFRGGRGERRPPLTEEVTRDQP